MYTVTISRMSFRHFTSKVNIFIPKINKRILKTLSRNLEIISQQITSYRKERLNALHIYLQMLL